MGYIENNEKKLDYGEIRSRPFEQSKKHQE
jgi:hypothetical protein